MFTFQNEACLDVLVRSFNEVFSPIIETGEDRIEEPHDVDELTHFYRRDEDGNLVLKRDGWLPSNPYVGAANPKSSKSRSKNMVGSLFNHLQVSGKAADPGPDTVACHKTDGENRDLNQDQQPDSSTDAPNSSPNPENISRFESESVYPDSPAYGVEYEEYPEYDTYDYHPRGGYVPGRRPFLDLVIKLLESLQLTAKSKFMVYRPRYTTSEYQPSTEEKYK